jgi:predicted nucleic acid-binding protein
MFLIIDTNVLFSLVVKGKVRKLFKQLWKERINPIIPEFSKEELLEIKSDLMKFARLNEKEFEQFINDLGKFVKVIPMSVYEQFLDEAKKISPHKKDAPLFALSLAFNKAPIWSRDLRLRRQKFVKVLSDKEVEELLKKSFK